MLGRKARRVQTAEMRTTLSACKPRAERHLSSSSSSEGNWPSVWRVSDVPGGSAIQRFPLIEKPKTYWGTSLIEFGAHFVIDSHFEAGMMKAPANQSGGLLKVLFDWFCICPSAFYSGFILLCLTKDDGAC